MLSQVIDLRYYNLIMKIQYKDFKFRGSTLDMIYKADEIINDYQKQGYPSQSSVWRTGERFKYYLECGHDPIIIYLGDHDRDIEDRLYLFTNSHIKIERIALSYKLPENPTKETDSRSSNYDYESSWELDALEPKVINELLCETILKFTKT